MAINCHCLNGVVHERNKLELARSGFPRYRWYFGGSVPATSNSKIREDAVVRCISGLLLQTRGVSRFVCLREKNLVDSGGMLRISNLAPVDGKRQLSCTALVKLHMRWQAFCSNPFPPSSGSLRWEIQEFLVVYGTRWNKISSHCTVPLCINRILRLCACVCSCSLCIAFVTSIIRHIVIRHPSSVINPHASSMIQPPKSKIEQP